MPILKKPTLDPSVAKHYRPVIVSNILSKIIELYIVDVASNFRFNDFQFSFIEGRGTSTAISLSHDVAAYCNSKGSSVFLCGLDAEGAFDGIPHPVLFNKAMNVVPDDSWRLLYYWYKNITVQIRWGSLGKSIEVCKGTRQGGLTSTSLFNLFYKDLIDELSSDDGGISIGSMKFNVFCYVDDILIASTTASGLQNLINCADNYITEHGLKFNSSKTKCIIYGKDPFVTEPEWHINNTILHIAQNIDYLGAVLGNNGCNAHIQARVRSCRKAFYSLQGTGLCKQGLNIQTAVHVVKSTCNSILTYGCEAMFLSNGNKKI